MTLAALREATRETHERLHHHEMLNGLQKGTITTSAYVSLLGKLKTYYAALPDDLEPARQRLLWLDHDLQTLGASRPTAKRLDFSAGLSTPARLLGAEYVIEGSALGGRLLATGASRFLGNDPAAGYRFFEGHGTETGARWRAFVTKLDSAAGEGLPLGEIVSGAVFAFDAFEACLTDHTPAVSAPLRT